MSRYRQVHDLMHVLTGCPISVSGEVALKWFELIQTGLPMTGLAAVFGTLRSEPAARGHVPSAMWAVRAATACEDLLAVPYEAHWETPLISLRASLRLEPFPPTSAVPSIDPALNPAAATPADAQALIEHYNEAARHQNGRKNDAPSPFLTAVDNLQRMQAEGAFDEP